MAAGDLIGGAAVGVGVVGKLEQFLNIV